MRLNRKTQTWEHPKDRTAELRALLETPEDVDISIPLLRTMSRVLIDIDKDIYRVPFLSNQIAQLNLTLQDFIHEYLRSRRTNEEEKLEDARKKYEEIKDNGTTDEIEFYRTRYEKARAKVEGTSQKLEAVQLGQQSAAQQVTKTLTPGESFVHWLKYDMPKDIGRLVAIAVFVFIVNALWAAFKKQLGVP